MGSSSKNGSNQTVFWGRVLCKGGPGPLKRIFWLEKDGALIWKSRYGLAVTGDTVSLDTDIGEITIYAGTQTQVLSSYWSSEPDHKGQILLEGYIEYGTERDTPPSFNLGCNNIIDGLVSPLEAVKLLYCNPYFGLGLDENAISYDADLIDKTRYFSYSIDSETSFSDFLDDALPLAFFTWRFEHGKLDIIRQFEPPQWDDVPHINQNNWLEYPKIKAETPTERINRTIVKYREFYNKGNVDDNTDGIYDNVNVWLEPTPVTGVKQTTIQAGYILNQSYAAQFTAAKGHQQACCLTTGSVSIKKQAFAYNLTAIHQPIRVWCVSSNSYINARVTDQTIYAGENRVDLDFEMDTTSSIHEQGSLGYEASSFTSYTPEDPRAVLILELPRPLANQAAVGLFIARGNKLINGYGVYSAIDGVNFVYSGLNDSFSVYGNLTSYLDENSTEFSLNNVTIDQDMLESVSVAQAEADEILGIIGKGDRYEYVSVRTVTQTGDDTFDLVVFRGRFGTLPMEHGETTDFFMIRRTALPIISDPITEPSPIINTALHPDGGNTYTFHLPQRIVTKPQKEGDCPDVLSTINGIYARPLPPQNLIVTQKWAVDQSDMVLEYDLIAWRDEGYPGADFYEADDLKIQPVVIIDGDRYLLTERPKGARSVTISEQEVINAVGYMPVIMSISIYTFYNGRYSSVGASTSIQPATLIQDIDLKYLKDIDEKLLTDPYANE